MKTRTIGLVLLMAASGLAISATPLSATPEPIGMVLDTPEGIVYVPASSVDHDARCTGEAPTDFYCSNGSHTRTTGLTHGFVFPYGENGVVESRVIVPGGNARVFRCNITNGAISGCAGSGSFPAVGETFDHDCFRYMPGSRFLPLPPMHGVPQGVIGGSGAINCQVYGHGSS